MTEALFTEKMEEIADMLADPSLEPEKREELKKLQAVLKGEEQKEIMRLEDLKRLEALAQTDEQKKALQEQQALERKKKKALREKNQKIQVAKNTKRMKLRVKMAELYETWRHRVKKVSNKKLE